MLLTKIYNTSCLLDMNQFVQLTLLNEQFVHMCIQCRHTKLMNIIEPSK